MWLSRFELLMALAIKCVEGLSWTQLVHVVMNLVPPRIDPEFTPATKRHLNNMDIDLLALCLTAHTNKFQP